MTQATALGASYIVAARRTALGRPGGLHKCRRIESLTAPVVLAALAGRPPRGGRGRGDHPRQYHGGRQSRAHRRPCCRPRRQRAGADRRPPVRLRPRCDPARHARRGVGRGQCRRRRRGRVPLDGAVAGGAAEEPVPDAALHGLRAGGRRGAEAPHSVVASEELARRLGITRDRQDSYTLHSHLKAERAASERRFVGEIVPLRMAGAEARDEVAGVADIDELAALAPLLPPDGTHTTGNTSLLHDAAAIVVIVSAQVHADLGAPRALKLVASSTQGVGCGGGSARAGDGAGEAAAGEWRLLAQAARSGRDVGDVGGPGPGAARCLRSRRPS